MLAVMLLAAGPLVEALHLSHSHRFCSEHQTFEEVERSNAASLRDRGGDEQNPGGDERSVEGTQAVSELESSHTACPVCGSPRPNVSPLRSSLEGLAIHWDLQPRDEDRSVALLPFSVLARAPKSSPPA